MELEEVIIRTLGNIGVVDGHDAGSGEMNIFIHTDHPKLAFDHLRQLVGTKDFMPDLKVAYREIGNEEFVILHPPALSHFRLT
ncbi:MAG TPA: ABC transporter [Verrucomicrobiae bacterium]|nr:ABC transporter [Verrucomicrobiae bacterium]